jgi:site-specific DNA recombinase
MRAAIYARVSTEEQKERQTIKPQLEELPKYAAAQGWIVVNIYKDEGRSGESIMGRSQFQQLLRDAEAGQFDVVLAIDRDRLARSEWAEEMAFIQDKFRKHHILVAFPGTTLDLDKPEDRLVDDIRGGVARYEKHQIVKRMRRGKLSKLREGKVVDGSLPYGYTRAADCMPTIHPEHEPVVQRIFKMLLVEDLSLNKIAARFNAEGIKSPLGRRWKSTPLSRVVKNPVYYQGFTWSQRYAHRFEWMPSKKYPGKEVRRRFVKERPASEWIKIAVPPLISKREWTAVQKRITGLRWTHGRPRKPTQGPDAYILRTIGRCGPCGARLQCRDGTAEGSRYYYCLYAQPHAQKRDGKTCSSSSWIPAAAAERVPLSILLHSLLMPEDVVRQYAEMVTGESYLKQLRERLAQITAETKTVRDQERRLLDKALTKHFSPEAISAKTEELRSQLEWKVEQQENLAAELAAAEEKQKTVAWMREQSRTLFHHRRTLDQWWKRSSPSDRRALLRALVDPEGGGTILVYPPPPGYTPTPELDMDGWGGRVDLKFVFQPERVVQCLQTLGVVQPEENVKGPK